DPAALQLLDDAARDDVEDAPLAMCRAGADARLLTGQRDRLAPDGAQGHGQQRGGDHLAGADQLVHLPRRRVVVELMGEGDELVGGVAHGADHDDHAVAEPACALDPLGHPADALGGGDAAAPVLLDDVVHNAGGYASRLTRAPKLRTRLTTVRPRSPQRFAAAISASWTASG